MLSTLSKIGEQLLQGKGIWAQLTTEPKFDDKKTNWVCPILFDCIEQKITILKDKIQLFQPDDSIMEFRYISTELWGRNGKKCALTVAPKNFSMLEETLFGKGKAENGDMVRSINELHEFKNRPLYDALNELFVNLKDKRNLLDLAEFKKELDLGNQDEVVLFYTLIKSEKINNGIPIRIVSLEGYDEFILKRFGPTDGEMGLNYLSGELDNNVTTAKFQRGYNINAVFQTTFINYSSDFSDFKANFQTSTKNAAYLDKAGIYILDKLQFKIAGINHIAIPNFLNKDLHQLDIEETELFLDHSSDLLFRYNDFDSDLDKELPELSLFWINYLAFESDGNSFKILNHIKDVNSKYLRHLIEVFDRTGIEFHKYINNKYTFNLQSIYFIVPVRDGGKSKNNQALHLFKNILEQAKISAELLFKYFIDLILCHLYGRYAAFPNIRKIDSFDFAVKDAVFKYSALFYALKQLNLINMEKEEEIEMEKTIHDKTDFQQRIDSFFEKMKYAENEKAMFYLGRVLSAIAYAQYKKGHESKPVLNKVNYNGMDAQAIVRLSLDLSEKVRQYNIHRETDGNFARFRELFNQKSWSLSNEQNVFYLMAGYSFGLTKSENI